MKRLYDNITPDIKPQPVIEDSGPSLEEYSEQIDQGFNTLDKQFKAYDKVDSLHTTISTEDKYLLSPTNRFIFNEYVSNLQNNLGVDLQEVIATEELDNPVLVQHHQIAMENIITKIWDTMKRVFKAIADAIVGFYKRFFTKLGRVKARLQNLQKTISKTDKDVKQLSMDKVPSAIKRAFPYEGTIGESQVASMVKMGDTIKSILKVINDGAENLATKDIIDADTVARMKALKDTASAAQNKINDENVFNQAAGKMGAGITEGAKNVKDANKVKKEAEVDFKKDARTMDDIVKSKDNKNIVDDKDGEDRAKGEFVAYLKKITAAFKPLLNEKLPNGEILTKVDIDNEGNVSIEKDKNSDTPDAVSLGSKASLTALVKGSLDLILDVEKMSEKGAKVSDLVNKNLSNIDKLMSDLEKVKGTNNATYKNLLQTKIKPRLNLFKEFYSNHSKFNKNLLEMTVNIGDGVVVYSTESLKRFG